MKLVFIIIIFFFHLLLCPRFIFQEIRTTAACCNSALEADPKQATL